MENISKIIISKEAGEKLGYVLDNVFGQNFELLGFVVAEEENENEAFLAIKDAKIFKDFIFVENATSFQFLANQSRPLIGKRMISFGGVDFGRVLGYEIKNRRCHKLWTDKCEILASKISFVGEDFLFCGKCKKPTAPKKSLFPRLDNNLPESLVEIQERTEEKLPQKLVMSTENFLGKVAQCDVFGYNNERIIAKGEKVTKTTVERARQHNRINQLYFATKNLEK